MTIDGMDHGIYNQFAMDPEFRRVILKVRPS